MTHCKLRKINTNWCWGTLTDFPEKYPYMY